MPLCRTTSKPLRHQHHSGFQPPCDLQLAKTLILWQNRKPDRAPAISSDLQPANLSSLGAQATPATPLELSLGSGKCFKELTRASFTCLMLALPGTLTTSRNSVSGCSPHATTVGGYHGCHEWWEDLWTSSGLRDGIPIGGMRDCDLRPLRSSSFWLRNLRCRKSTREPAPPPP